MMKTNPTSPRPARHVIRRGALALVLAATLGAASACSSAEAAGSAADLLPANTMLIDVRTPGEFAEARLDGAVNVPVELSTFAAQVASLDPSVEYLVYCRSGRRADVAIAYMETLGLSATNLGSVESAASATGIRIVR